VGAPPHRASSLTEMSSTETEPTRTRTPRHEARQNVLNATLELLTERDPEQITVRDIAERSGHHHRFIQDWFGGKANLFAEAFQEINAEIAQMIGFEGDVSTGPDPLIVRSVRLMNWLVANDPSSVTGERMRPVVNRVQNMYQDRFGIDADTARLLAQRMMFIMTGVVLFKDVFGVAEIDLPKQVALEFDIARRLGTRPG
jgi:AcrR family transcriptional regulator